MREEEEENARSAPPANFLGEGRTEGRVEAAATAIFSNLRFAATTMI